jgi:hypothetical protein
MGSNPILSIEFSVRRIITKNKEYGKYIEYKDKNDRYRNSSIAK